MDLPGEIENHRIVLSEIGEIAQKEWIRTPQIRPDMNIVLDEYCSMPNHFHGIIIIGKNKYNRHNIISRRDAMHGVSTTHGVNTPTLNGKHNNFSPQRKNLSSVIRGFKSSVTMNARKNNTEFAWQTRFYDHIIRDDTLNAKRKNHIPGNRMVRAFPS